MPPPTCNYNVYTVYLLIYTYFCLDIKSILGEHWRNNKFCLHKGPSLSYIAHMKFTSYVSPMTNHEAISHPFTDQSKSQFSAQKVKFKTYCNKKQYKPDSTYQQQQIKSFGSLGGSNLSPPRNNQKCEATLLLNIWFIYNMYIYIFIIYLFVYTQIHDMCIYIYLYSCMHA